VLEGLSTTERPAFGQATTPSEPAEGEATRKCRCLGKVDAGELRTRAADRLTSVGVAAFVGGRVIPVAAAAVAAAADDATIAADEDDVDDDDDDIVADAVGSTTDLTLVSDQDRNILDNIATRLTRVAGTGGEADGRSNEFVLMRRSKQLKSDVSSSLSASDLDVGHININNLLISDFQFSTSFTIIYRDLIFLLINLLPITSACYSPIVSRSQCPVLTHPLC
jgi:hypothetical protein